MVTISVVMSVLNGGSATELSVRSILDQTESDLEFIIVDDGSTDSTPQTLRRFSDEDARVRVIRQDNSGLTRALIAGCDAARGEFIARQDCGDHSFPNRLERQLAIARRGHILVSCATQYVGPAGEPLYVASGHGDRVRHSLLNDDVTRIRGLSHHGSALFRRDAYVRAGGYRSEFRFAQDLDLWIRLAKEGSIAFDEEVLYEATYEPSSISALRQRAQVATAELALLLRDAAPTDHRSLLSRVEEVTARRERNSHSLAPGYYFIASCLLANGDPRWRHYARMAVREDPTHFRAWWKLMTQR